MYRKSNKLRYYCFLIKTSEVCNFLFAVFHFFLICEWKKFPITSNTTFNKISIKLDHKLFIEFTSVAYIRKVSFD